MSSGESFLTSAATDAAGSAEFEEVPPGPLVIVERAVAYEALKVYCGETSILESTPPTTWQELPISDESVEYQAQPGTRITCYWINAEVEYPDVIVHKYTCPDGYAPEGNNYQEIAEACTAPPPGVDFALSAGGSDVEMATDSDGAASWDEVAPGAIGLTETPHPDYPNVIVFCAAHSLGGEQGEYLEIQVEEYAIEGVLETGYSVECYWFNYQEHTGTQTEESPAPTSGDGGAGGTGVQAGDQTGGKVVVITTPGPGEPVEATLIITKYTCPEGYDVHDPESDPVEDCEDLTDDIEFALSLEGEEDSLTRITGDDGEGTVEFADLDAGVYLLTETLPEDSVSAFIYTCQSDRRAFQVENPFKPFAYAGPDGRIGVVLVAGERPWSATGSTCRSCAVQ